MSVLDEKAVAESFIQIDMPVNDAVHADVGYLDGFVDGQGVLFEHWSAMPCPLGLDDPYDSRHNHDHSGCSGGFIYTKSGEMACTFTGNSKSIQALDPGLVTGSTAQLTLPRFYSDNPRKEVSIAPFDRLYLKSNVGTVICTQMYEHSITGKDRLKYPVVEVELLIDARGNRYYPGEAFSVIEGLVVWNGTAQPGMNPETRRGEVCSIRYKYIPFWYVDRILHEIRLVRNGDLVVRAPMSILIQREYFFENEQNRKTTDSPRQAAAPRDGAFGVR